MRTRWGWLLGAAMLVTTGCFAGGDEAGETDVELDGGAELTEAPELLSETGLFESIEDKTIAQGIDSFTPRFELWSDGAHKTRWVKLPAGTAIDTTDMDHWELPVGAFLWKEFQYDGKRIETRVSHRFGPGANDWWFATYQWSEDETEAVRITSGADDVRGTRGDIPREADCMQCHGKLPERALGFSAIQLTHEGSDLDLDALRDEGRLSTTPPAVRVPGDATTVAALGYLHANCSHCHNATAGIAFAQPYRLRLLVSETTVEQTGAMTTAVGVPVEGFAYPGVTHRIAAGDPGSSCVPTRMSHRDDYAQMPPVATHEVDEAGVALIRQWIASLPPAASE